jgi:hypothetical protein
MTSSTETLAAPVPSTGATLAGDNLADDAMSGILAKLSKDVELARAALENAQLRAVEIAALCADLTRVTAAVPRSVRRRDSLLPGYAEVVFEVSNREEALTLLGQLPGVPVVCISGGCTSFQPEALAKPRGGEKTEPVGPVVYRLEKNYAGALEETFFWWTQLGEHLVKVSAASAKDIPPAATAQGYSKRNGRDMLTRWAYGGLPEGKTLFWYGGSSHRPSPVSVHFARDADVASALRADKTAAHGVTTPACECD